MMRGDLLDRDEKISIGAVDGADRRAWLVAFSPSASAGRAPGTARRGVPEACRCQGVDAFCRQTTRTYSKAGAGMRAAGLRFSLMLTTLDRPWESDRQRLPLSL